MVNINIQKYPSYDDDNDFSNVAQRYLLLVAVVVYRCITIPFCLNIFSQNLSSKRDQLSSGSTCQQYTLRGMFYLIFWQPYILSSALTWEDQELMRGAHCNESIETYWLKKCFFFYFLKNAHIWNNVAMFYQIKTIFVFVKRDIFLKGTQMV